MQSYLSNGFLVVEDLVTGDELEELKRDVVRVARGDYSAEGLEPAGGETPATRRCSTRSCASTSRTTSAR